MLGNVNEREEFSMKAFELLAMAREEIESDESLMVDEYAYLAMLAIDLSTALLEQDEGMGKWHVSDAMHELLRAAVKADTDLVF